MATCPNEQIMILVVVLILSHLTPPPAQTLPRPLTVPGSMLSSIVLPWVSGNWTKEERLHLFFVVLICFESVMVSIEAHSEQPLCHPTSHSQNIQEEKLKVKDASVFTVNKVSK